MSTLAMEAIATKIKGMNKRLLTRRDLETLCSFSSIGDAISYLQATPGYKEALHSLNPAECHREAIEQLLNNALYEDYVSLYRFATAYQRRLMHIAFLHYETELLKRCMRQLWQGHPVIFDFGSYDDFFDVHTDFAFDDLLACKSLEDFAEAMSKSIYYPPIARSRDNGKNTIFDYESAIDLHYLSLIWKWKEDFKPFDRNLLTEVWGTRSDLLNCYWIYRCRTYFNMVPAAVYELLIPISHKLTREQIKQMTEGERPSDFFEAFNQTVYHKALKSNDQKLSFEQLEVKLIDDIYRDLEKKKPYSMATLFRYLYRKEREIKTLIPIIEGIRYRMPAETIRGYLN